MWQSCQLARASKTGDRWVLRVVVYYEFSILEAARQSQVDKEASTTGVEVFSSEDGNEGR